MGDGLKLSICIVAMNEEHYLPNLLNDMRNQKYPHELTEIVLIDSASSDKTKSIMMDFQKENNGFYSVQVLDNPKKIQAAGWNVAIKNATGDVISRIDAHTMIPPEFSALVMQDIEEGEDIVGGIRPCIIENVFEDLLLSPFIFEKASKIVLLDKTLLFHREHSHSITASYSEKKALDWLYVIKTRESFIKEHALTVFDPKRIEEYESELFSQILLHMLPLYSFRSTYTKNCFKKEIRERAKRITNYSWKSRLLYGMYKFNPYLSFILLQVYRFYQSLLVFIKKIVMQCIRRSVRATFTASGTI